MKARIIVAMFAIFTVTGIRAGPPTKMVDVAQQANRDSEKAQILNNELREQKDLAAQLAQQKAVALANDNKDEVTQIEARLDEVGGNITQIQQEINLSHGSPASLQPVAVHKIKATNAVSIPPPKTDDNQDPATAKEKSGQWWDLYGRKTRQ